MFTKKQNYFDLNLKWDKTGKGEFPYILNYDNHVLQIRINDFPEEPLYSLIVDSEVICDFEKWPPNWIK